MQFDFLDIRGSLRIKGNVGFPGGAPSFNNGTIEWAQSGIGVSTYSIIGSTGYNYVIVGATGTPLENGQRLSEANDYALSNWSGSPAIDNRFSLLLLPGEYDLTSPPSFGLNPNNYVDIIGISSNPYHTIIKGGFYTINYGLLPDSILENVYLLGDVSCFAPGLSEFPRWKNVVVGGKTFDEGWEKVKGEFTNIIVEDGSKFAYAKSGIDATFKNIIAHSVSNMFELYDLGDINGTFSDVQISYVDSGVVFSSPTGSVYGQFNNIKINKSRKDIFFSQNDLVGNFKNIYIGEVENGSVFSSGTISGSFQNVEIGTIYGAAFTASNANGEFKNIKISNVIGDVFKDFFTASFENLDIGKVSGKAFTTTAGDMDFIMDNFNVGEVGGTIFRSDSFLYGTYSNFIIGPVTEESFISKTAIVVNLKNYKIIASASSVFSADSVSIDSHNGEIVDALKFISSGGCQLVLKDTKLSFKAGVSSNICITAGDAGVLSATISNLLCSDATDVIFGNRIFGDFRNIRFGNITGYFINQFNTSSGGPVVYDDITTGNISDTAFKGVVDFNPIIRNVKLGNCGSAFIGVSLNATLNNIEVGNVSGDFVVGTFSTSFGRIEGDYRNIKVGNVSRDAFRAFQNIGLITGAQLSGVFKDIEIASARNVFKTSLNNPSLVFMNNARLENIKIGTCSTIFDAVVKENVRVRNLEVDGGWTSNIYQGSLENSFINSSSKPFTVTLGTSSVITRSTVLSPSGTPLSVAVGRQYLSRFNQVTGLSTPTGFTNSDYNIIDTDIS